MRKLPKGGRRTVATATVLAALLAGCGESSPESGPDAAAPPPGEVVAAGEARAHVYRSPSCDCCGGHADHLTDAGLDVVEHHIDDMAEVKEELGVPGELSSCHTTVISGYVVEGHVPADDIERLLGERPDITGIALAGMPAGSPGMPGELEAPLDVRAFSDGADAGPVE